MGRDVMRLMNWKTRKVQFLLLEEKALAALWVLKPIAGFEKSWGVESWSPPSRRSNPIPAIPPFVVTRPHLHGAPTTEETVKI